MAQSAPPCFSGAAVTTENNNVRDDSFSPGYKRFVLVMLTVVYAFNRFARMLCMHIEPVCSSIQLRFHLQFLHLLELTNGGTIFFS